MGYKVAKEVAEVELDRFLDGMGIESDKAYLDAGEYKDLERTRRKCIKHIMLGNLVVNDDDEAVYTPYRAKSTHKDPITFFERTGRVAMAAIDNKAAGGSPYAPIAKMVKLPVSVFDDGLAGEDLAMCESIAVLLT